MSEIVPADKRLQRATLIAVGVLLLAGFALLHYGLPRYLDYLRALARRDPNLLDAEYRRAFLAIFLLIGILSAAIGVHLLRIGRAVLRHAQFPPPTVKVIIDTKILRDAAARRLAYLMNAIGALLILVGIGGSAGMYYKTMQLLDPNIAAERR